MRHHLLLAIGLCVALAGGCSAGAGPSAACHTDADCVPASCCHATACVPRADAPDCEGVACTRECRPGTLDCGGTCVCTDGRCTPRFP